MRQLIHPDRQEAHEDGARQALVDLFDETVVDAGANTPRHQFEGNGGKHAQRQHQQGLQATGGHHAVIHLHAVKRGGQCNQVDHQAAQHRFTDQFAAGKDLLANELVYRTGAGNKGRCQLEHGVSLGGRLGAVFLEPALARFIQPFTDPLVLRVLATQHAPLPGARAAVRVDERRHQHRVGCGKPARGANMKVSRHCLELALRIVGRFQQCSLGGFLQRQSIHALVLQLGQPRQTVQQVRDAIGRSVHERPASMAASPCV